MTAIIRLAHRIDTLTHMEFTATPLSGSQTGWQAVGRGMVATWWAQSQGQQVARLKESGELRIGTGRSVPFSNIYRLTWVTENEAEDGADNAGEPTEDSAVVWGNTHATKIRLHHERWGAEHAVWLFDLIQDPRQPDRLISQAPHPCGADRYSAELILQDHGFLLHWTIQGPKKNERLEYHYH